MTLYRGMNVYIQGWETPCTVVTWGQELAIVDLKQQGRPADEYSVRIDKLRVAVEAGAPDNPEDPTAHLCYVRRGAAYFISDMGKAWGDDWNDAPYECNAGVLYPPRKGDTFKAYVASFACEADEPCDINMSVSVQTINAGITPWLQRGEKRVFAGASIGEFRAFVAAVGGVVSPVRAWSSGGQ